MIHLFTLTMTMMSLIESIQKDSTGLMDVLKTAVRQLNKDDNMRKKCQDLASIFTSHCQMGEAEAYYKLFPHMNLVYSSVATV